jgi:hypothetical protein
MSRPPISSRKLSDTLTLSECHPTSDHKGKYWLYDKTQGMNLAMGANTEEGALLEALDYYQTYLTKYKNSYFELLSKVNNFVDTVSDEEK